MYFGENTAVTIYFMISFFFVNIARAFPTFYFKIIFFLFKNNKKLKPIIKKGIKELFKQTIANHTNKHTESEQLKKNFFPWFCLLTLIRIASLKSQSQWTSVLPTRVSISSRLCSLMHISFFLYALLICILDTDKNSRIVHVFPHFVYCSYVGRNFIVDIV